MSPGGRSRLLLFLALFSGAAGLLFTLLACGTEYWLLAAETCSSSGGEEEQEQEGEQEETARIFHEGLFHRCSFKASSPDFSIQDIWMTNQPGSKVCHAAFLFPFPVREPLWLRPHGLTAEPYERPSAIVFRTFWSIFLVTGVTAAMLGGLLAICIAPTGNLKMYRVSGLLQLCGGFCLLLVVLMYLMWVQVLDTLEDFALGRRDNSCPAFHLSVQHGPSFLMAPVAVFFCLLAGVLFSVLGRTEGGLQSDLKVVICPGVAGEQDKGEKGDAGLAADQDSTPQEQKQKK